MSLLDQWKNYFTGQIRMRGRAYYDEGKVRQTTPSNGERVRAEVDGTEPYIVTIAGEGAQSSVECTCPHFADGFYCKHIWATLIDVDVNGVAGREDEDVDDDAPPPPPKARKRTSVPADQVTRTAAEPRWMGRLSLLRSGGSSSESEDHAPDTATTARQICYVIDVERSEKGHDLVLQLRQRTPTQTGWSKLRPFKVAIEDLGQLQPEDRHILAAMIGARKVYESSFESSAGRDRPHGQFRLGPESRWELLQRIIATKRCFAELYDDDPRPVVWDDQPAWVLYLAGQREDGEVELNLELRQGERVIGLDEPDLVLGGIEGVVIHDGIVAKLNDRGAARWITQFRDELRSDGHISPLTVPDADVDGFAERLYRLPQLPELDLPEGVGPPERHVEPTVQVELISPPQSKETASSGTVTARVWMRYAEQRVRPLSPGRFIHDEENAALIRRDLAEERTVLAALADLGFRPNTADDGQTMVLPAKTVHEAIGQMLQRGWSVLADDAVMREAGSPRLSVSSGIDWFELRGGITFETADGEQLVGLPEILAAARAGKTMIELADGSQGLLPEEWMQQQGLLAALGEEEEDHLRFKAPQAALLDALLSEQHLVEMDAKFQQARERIANFKTIDPVEEPDTFKGELRTYQREGLGWLAFLRDLGFGGILADDMGLGKTIQVLAMLEERYRGENALPADHPPTLIAVPKSVAYNWQDEAKRFTPDLRVHVYEGSDREDQRASFEDQDIVVTSYGLVRRDITELREHPFDYVILDEAQAIKNPDSQLAKASRLLQAEHRLALTGTPVENHLGDLWSIFEFLNPGLLGVGAKFSELFRGRGKDLSSVATARKTAAMLRPFILRRTKQQVLKELPEKIEQTIVCEMEPAQRKVYDQLLEHYRGTLLKEVGGKQVGGSAMMVLEALLRLRQAACHPALIDGERDDAPSAKLDTLVENIGEIIDEGSKALVFSQFTSMLSLVRKRLDAAGVAYEYLDGQTRNRRERIERFQTDAECPVFLISLKAGGFGLNLTAAEYVFILDPWWNPAVEQQAIDRAHRIGQTRRVFAYRLVCKDTVEQRIIELQQAKQQLADAIVGGDQSPLRNLTRDDLEQLLS